MTDEMAAHIAKLLEQLAIDMGENRKMLARVEAKLERALAEPVAVLPAQGIVR